MKEKPTFTLSLFGVEVVDGATYITLKAAEEQVPQILRWLASVVEVGRVVAEKPHGWPMYSAFRDGLTLREAAKRLGCTHTTVKRAWDEMGLSALAGMRGNVESPTQIDWEAVEADLKERGFLP